MLENNTEVNKVDKKTTCSLCEIKVGNGFLNQEGNLCILSILVSTGAYVIVYKDTEAVKTHYGFTYQVTPINLKISFTGFEI